jgi:ribonuclease PH
VSAARPDGRATGQLRAVRFEPGFIGHAEGSVLVAFGRTRVVCTASVEDRVPPHRKGSGGGWVTAEYGMLPRATSTRNERAGVRGRPQDGRAVEIQRLVGRALRAGVDLGALGERQVTIDCDVLEADGGTRTAAVTGGYVALALALRAVGAAAALRRAVAAVSVGLVDGEARLDLCYEEDAHAAVDLNVVGTDAGELVEVQGTAEGQPFRSVGGLDRMVALALEGVAQLCTLQRAVLG